MSFKNNFNSVSTYFGLVPVDTITGDIGIDELVSIDHTKCHTLPLSC